ncbi:MAG: beta-ketoacyl-[acyl-carrier-protein] synthase family protein, partial [Chromatiales bacterium]|nr:beta-ketoacyl-[acyl-carrier-protein] synthase family protein [Chromatiales bacterium]
MDDRRIVVTGLGCISALGHSAADFWSALKVGRSGIRPLRFPEVVDLKVSIGGAIGEPDPRTLIDERRSAMLDRFSVLALIAAEQALDQAGLRTRDDDGARIGCVVGVGIAGWEAIEESYRRLLVEGAKRTNVFTVPKVMPSAAASQISMAHGLRGPVFGVSSACSSSNHAIACAVALLRAGVADVMLAGGTEAPLIFGILKAWDALRVLAPDACRPFDRHRKGLVLSEGAGMVVLERADHAKARGAEILAELAGVGMSADAGDLVAPTVEGPAAAMRACLADARLAPEAIDYVNAHGTGTVANDITEIKAIKAVFGARASTLSISSTKSMHGHALGASGALELIAMIEAVRTGIVPPTIGIEELDPE